MATGNNNVIKAKIDDRDIVIDKSNDALILTEDCKKIMKNICSPNVRPGDFTSTSADLTQPSFLNPEEKALFFRMKMFFLLQERHSVLYHEDGKERQDADIAEAYPLYLSPFGEPSLASDEPPKLRRRRRRKQPGGQSPDSSSSDSAASGGHPRGRRSSRGRADTEAKTGIAKFIESIRKADASVHRTLEEKLLKTSEGKGLSSLFPSEMQTCHIEMCMFPDYKILMSDGKDEEAKLNNLVIHTRNRMKAFEKMQAFYESGHEDNNACMFTVPISEVTGARDILTHLLPRRWHMMDEKKLDSLFVEYDGDFSAAKTSLVADGTQPIVIHPSKLESLKKYVREFTEVKQMLLPYQREQNFCFMHAPWKSADQYANDLSKGN